MYRFYINKIHNDYHFSELARVFLPDDQFEVIKINRDDIEKIVLGKNRYIINKCGSDDRDSILRELYLLLQSITGIKSEWGILTGVRPLKNALKIYEEVNSISDMRHIMTNRYLLSESKLNLLTEIAKYQLSTLNSNPSDMVGIYIGIPFCPTRCSYCSFASNVGTESEIVLYHSNLLKEIEYMGELIRNHKTKIESIYIGGGTPTTLSATQLKVLIEKIYSSFNVDAGSIEFTIEAGRPDTITAEKLQTIRNLGINRISINPQSMKASTLDLIGRRHSPKDIIEAFELAKEYDFNVINADIIAGLPEESFDDFKNTIETVLKLGANNITVHTLSVKKGSQLKEDDPEYYRRNVNTVSSMLNFAHDELINNDFHPYYIYKQKHQIGALENVGYCKEGKHSIYNIRIMEEKQTIIALGAGAIGKVYFPDEDRLERIPNVYNYQIYNERFNEMLERKNSYFGG